MHSSRGCGFRGQVRSRRALGASVVAVLAGLAPLAVPGAALADTTATTTFTTPGEYSFTVPAGLSSISVTAVGGAGGSCVFGWAGGEAASVSGTVPVSGGEQLSITVAGPGSNCAGDGPEAGGIGGGGTGGSGADGGGAGAGGGGASIVKPQIFPAALIVAGGGGGAALGSAGGTAGAAGQSGSSTGGGAGTATAGGAGGVDGTGNANGAAGGPFVGGAGGGGSNAAQGGGGGAGLFGGGGGSQTLPGLPVGGGGGSSFLVADATDASGPTVTTAPASVTITYATATADLSASALSFGSEPQGSLSTEQAVTVSNNGSAPLIVSGVQTAVPMPATT